jgi:4-hydroxy-tetrahydrodipicolinate synthase
LSVLERERMISIAVQMVGGRIPVLAGAGAANLEDTLRLTRYAEAAGADAVLVMPPYGSRPSQEGLYQYFRAVAQATSLPVVVDNVSERAAVNLEAEILARLVDDCPNVIGVKDRVLPSQRSSQEPRVRLPPDRRVGCALSSARPRSPALAPAARHVPRR